MIDFAQIARELSPSLFRRARQLTHDDAHAWDLVQDTFERCLRRFPQHVPTEKARAWLVAILNNLFIDGTRSCEARLCVRLADEAWQQVPHPETDELPRWEAFDPADVRAGLDHLPPVLRQAFELHDLEGLNYREIAARLNVNRATVGTRILRARRHMCNFLLAAGPRATASANHNDRAAHEGPRKALRPAAHDDHLFGDRALDAWFWQRSADAA